MAKKNYKIEEFENGKLISSRIEKGVSDIEHWKSWRKFDKNCGATSTMKTNNVDMTYYSTSKKIGNILIRCSWTLVE